MAALPRPSVTVIQEFETASPTILVPTLRPNVVGAAFEVVEVLNADQTINSASRDGAYTQFPQSIAQSSFPSPRSNIAEVDVLEESIRAFLTFGGSLYEMDNGDDVYGSGGSSFLAFANWAYRAAIVTTDEEAAYNFGAGMYLVLCIDNPLATDTATDVVVSLSGVMTAEEVAEAINDAVGDTVAYEWEDPASPGDMYVLIASTVYGAGSSVTIRAGSAAAAILFAAVGGSTLTYRVEGAGFRGQDDGDIDTITPWVEYSRGAYTEDGVAAAWPPAGAPAGTGPALLDEAYADPGDELLAMAPARTFTGVNPDVPLQAATTSRAGDTFWADGVHVQGAEVITAQTSRFKLGVLNDVNSVYDDDGNVVTRSYDTVEVGNLFDASPMAPRNAWFGASGLIEGSVTPVPQAAVLTGSEEGVPAQFGYLRGLPLEFGAGLDMTGYILYLRATVDDVPGAEQEIRFSGVYADMAAIAVEINGQVSDIIADSFDAGAITDPDIVITFAVDESSIAGATVTYDFSAIGGGSGTFKEGVDWNRVVGSVPNTMTALAAFLDTLPGVKATTPAAAQVTVELEHTVIGNNCEIDADFGYLWDGNPSGAGPYNFAGGAGGEFLVLQTAATGDDQQVEVLSTGSYNARFQLGLDVLAGSGIGRDVEFSERAEVTAGPDAAETPGPYVFPLVGGERLVLEVVDRNGTRQIDYTLAAGDVAAGTWIDLAAELNAGGNTAGQDPVGSFGMPMIEFEGVDTADSRGLIIHTLQGGSAVSIDVDTALTAAAFNFSAVAAQATLSVQLIGAFPAGGETVIVDATALGGPAVTFTYGNPAPDWQAGVGLPAQAAALATAIMDPLNGLTPYMTAAGDGIDTCDITMLAGLGYAGNLVWGQGNNAATVTVGGVVGVAATEATGGTTLNDSDAGANALTGNLFAWTMDRNPHIWEVTFTSESLDDAISLINEEMMDNVVATAGGTNLRQLVLTSLLEGQASWMNVSQAAAYTSAFTAFGMVTPNDEAQGSGRPNPDFYLDLSGGVVIGAQVLRNPVTGAPYDNSYVGASYIYLAYKGLRLDVTPEAATSPGLLVIQDTTQLESLLSPLTTDNPLGLGLFFAKLNAPGVSVTGIGVSDVSGAHPEGTLSAFTQCAEFLESEEVYAIAPLTHQPTVHQMFKVHVDYMSDPDQRGERILFFNPEVPTERNPTVAASGTDGNTTATTNRFICDENPAAGLIAAGVNPALPIPVSDGVYLEVTVAGELERYNVSSVNGALLVLNVTFASGENDDGFYTITPLSTTLVSVDWSLEVRGAPLTVAGQPDLDGIAETVAGIADTYGDRRLYMVFPDTFVAELDAGTTLLEGYYACAAIAGMVGQQLPQQGFTNFPITGFSGVQGSNDVFKDSLLDEIAGGGVYTVIQEYDGAALICRHQLSTDASTIETRELSITKTVDFVAKVMRTALRNYLGIFNITPQFVDTLTTVVEGLLEFLKGTGAILGATLNRIAQDTSQPDTILIDVTLDVPYPCNYIRLTLIV